MDEVTRGARGRGTDGFGCRLDQQALEGAVFGLAEGTLAKSEFEHGWGT